MAVLDAIVAPALTPSDLLGLELHFLDSIALRQTAPVLLVYAIPGRLISIGRYHMYSARASAPAEHGGIGIMRRLTGGRVVGAGEGWLGIALILPTRTSLLKETTPGLKPEQIMNRYARGLLAALRIAGLDCFYPGRDAITFDRREIAMCSFETNASGAMLFEVILAVNRGMEEVVHDLERVDPDGMLTCRMYGSDNATTVVRELGRDIGFAELADAIVTGYGNTLGEVSRREFSGAELAHGAHRGAALEKEGWLNAIGRDMNIGTEKAVLTNHQASQLGAVEARVALGGDGRIDRVVLSGDYIANSPSIAEFQGDLRGQPLDLVSVSRAVTKTFAQANGSRNFILGVGNLVALARLVADVQ